MTKQGLDTPGHEDDSTDSLLEDFLVTKKEVVERHEEAGSVVHDLDPNLFNDLVGTLAGTPKGFFFELLMHALRALQEGKIEKAIERMDGALGVASRNEEVDEDGGLVAGLVELRKDLASGETKAIVAVEIQLKGMEGALKESFGQ